METADGGSLRFESDSIHGLCPEVLAAVHPIPGREYADNPEVFNLTTALIDSEGRLWQRTRSVSIWELWQSMLEKPVFYPFESPSKDTRVRKPESSSAKRRILLKPVQTSYDPRESRLIEVIRERATDRQSSTQSPPEEPEFERLLFRLKFKYFGAEIGLVEERVFRTVGAKEVYLYTQLLVTVRPMVMSDLIVALNDRDQPIPAGEIELTDLGTLCSHSVRLRAEWNQQSELPRAGNLNAWRQAFQKTGIDPSTLRAFKPNPDVRYQPASTK